MTFEDLRLFPTPVRVYDFSQDPDIEKLKEIALKSSASPHGLINGAVSSYAHSSNILDNFAVISLRQKIFSCVKDMAQSLMLAPIEIVDSWFNIMQEGAQLFPHRHERSVISGALYLEAEPGSVGLRLHSPISQVRMNELLLGNNDLNTNSRTIDIKTGTMVLFPAWLEHSTNINKSQRRIVVSFNTNYGPQHLVDRYVNEWKKKHRT